MKQLVWILFVFLLAPGAVRAADTAPGKAEIFVTSWCPYCRQLESLLKKNKVEYTRYDVEQDPQGARLFAELGGEGVPLFRVGKKVIHGYDPGGILAALKESEGNPGTHHLIPRNKVFELSDVSPE